MHFRDRTHAGRVLATALSHYAGLPNLLVLGLPRGGVVVAFEVAEALHTPLDTLVVRKLGVPGHEELAMGAIATGGIVVVNHSVVESLEIPDEVFQMVVARQREELARREAVYRCDRPPPKIRGRCVIVVDDGLATGATMHAAVEALCTRQPERIIVAVPVAAVSTYRSLLPKADDLVCVATPEPFYGVGQWYDDFSQTSDEEVRDLLSRERGVGSGERGIAEY